VTTELDFGVRKVWEKGALRPYFGGGLGLVTGAREVDTGFGTVDDDDTALGIWIGGGIFWRLGSRFNIGLSARYSQASVDLFGVEVEAGDRRLACFSVGLAGEQVRVSVLSESRPAGLEPARSPARSCPAMVRSRPGRHGPSTGRLEPPGHMTLSSFLEPETSRAPVRRSGAIPCPAC